MATPSRVELRVPPAGFELVEEPPPGPVQTDPEGRGGDAEAGGGRRGRQVLPGHEQQGLAILGGEGCERELESSRGTSASRRQAIAIASAAIASGSSAPRRRAYAVIRPRCAKTHAKRASIAEV
jgi:hypothetical protein